jgi:hypothetical protein
MVRLDIRSISKVTDKILSFYIGSNTTPSVEANEAWQVQVHQQGDIDMILDLPAFYCSTSSVLLLIHADLYAFQ